MAHFLPSLPSDFDGRSPLRRTKSEAFFDHRSFSEGGSEVGGEGGHGTNFIKHYECRVTRF
jgi:hypothetical protein